ncbi:MAG: cyclic pyranopterin monophosphate synthase MoaC [Syntrophales bacterium]|jgi:cyclic pyranopterin phosphate synthase|nr:cyclic pyranopterin monophosphate synthase MoaC [Syntrophales bacterium]MDY0043431.1 cyclic pyranopterin monophosphate synthase MoaC [Syntrophales bacterium]
MSQFTHLDENGRSKMVDITEKNETVREAVASGLVLMNPDTVRAIGEREIPKGDVLGTAKIAGLLAAKKTSDIIPMCHPLSLTNIEIDFSADSEKGKISIKSTARTIGRTGVEMEALMAVSAAALTIYDMCKSADREIIISDIKLLKKSGGKSGVFIRKK